MTLNPLILMHLFLLDWKEHLFVQTEKNGCQVPFSPYSLNKLWCAKKGKRAAISAIM